MTDITLSFSVYLALIINGICTGLGVALGTWIAQNHIIGKTKKLIKRFKHD